MYVLIEMCMSHVLNPVTGKFMNEKDQQIKSFEAVFFKKYMLQFSGKKKKNAEFLHSETNTGMKCTVVTYLFFYSHSIKVLQDKDVLL